MAYTKKILYENLRTFDSSTLSGSYQALGTPLVHPASIVKVVNNSTVLVTISVDGVNDVDVSPQNSFWLYDYTTNSPHGSDDAIFVPQGTQYFVKGAAPGTGLIYLVVQYIVQV